jgi:hypothetical protein
MPKGGAHCTVLSRHCTSGERSTDCDISNNNGDDISRELLDDSYERREPIKGELEL